MKAPKLKQQVWQVPPVREDFEVTSLPLHWNYLRNPNEADYSLTARPGFLRLNGSAIRISDQDSPAFVGRRQTDLNCVASTLLEFDPKTDNEKAGLVVRQNDKYHYEIGVTFRDGKRQVFFRKIIDAQVIDPVFYADAPSGPVVLSIKATPLSYEFSFNSSTGEEHVLGTAPTKDLSVERIGFKDGMCFTGAYFGLYATGNGQACSVPADFDWFEYAGKD